MITFRIAASGQRDRLIHGGVPPGEVSRGEAGCATIRRVSATATRNARGKASRQRLDQLLVERGLAETRTKAQALILAGKVRVGEGDAARSDRKAGDLVDR